MTIEKILLEFMPKPENILPALKEVNASFGYIDEKNAKTLADYFSVPISRIYETASFYDTINLKKPPEVVVQVCFSTHCALKNSAKIISAIENLLGLKAGDENNPKFKLEKISCMGRCADGPVVVVNGKIYERVAESSVYGMLEDYL